MITIIIPTYNYARFLPDAIESALAQSVPDGEVEVLVVDDGSTDNTQEVIARYGTRLRCVCQANAGLSAARNTGMREARHDWVIFLDSDDMLAAGAAAALWQARQTGGKDWAVVAGRDRPVDVHGSFMFPAPQVSGHLTSVSARSLVLRNRFAPAVLADRRCLLDLGGFDAALRASEDRDMWIRVAARRPVALLDQITLLKRDHGSNMSRAAARQTAAIEQVLAKAFANPELRLGSQDRRLARAVCLYQSALMYADAGEYHSAACQMLRSLAQSPFGPVGEAGIPPLSRVRGLGGNLCRLFR
ncbi:MAG: glycosyltransferase [Verrucomicrobiaceae bacterium]|nr:glycosyltransferase [Verrucomicrobiaceae bacterium]